MFGHTQAHCSERRRRPDSPTCRDRLYSGESHGRPARHDGRSIDKDLHREQSRSGGGLSMSLCCRRGLWYAVPHQAPYRVWSCSGAVRTSPLLFYACTLRFIAVAPFPSTPFLAMPRPHSRSSSNAAPCFARVPGSLRHTIGCGRSRPHQAKSTSYHSPRRRRPRSCAHSRLHTPVQWRGRWEFREIAHGIHFTHRDWGTEER
jgi:hypothetical protein